MNKEHLWQKKGVILSYRPRDEQTFRPVLAWILHPPNSERSGLRRTGARRWLVERPRTGRGTRRGTVRCTTGSFIFIQKYTGVRYEDQLIKRSLDISLQFTYGFILNRAHFTGAAPSRCHAYAVRHSCRLKYLCSGLPLLRLLEVYRNFLTQSASVILRYPKENRKVTVD